MPIDAALFGKLFLLGIVTGGLGGLVGIGGGLFAIPLLGILFGLDQQHATGTGLVLIVPTVFVGLWSYLRRRAMDLRMGAALALAALPFTFIAARIATQVESAPLRIAFAIYLMFVAAYLAYRSLRPLPLEAPQRPARPWQLSLAVGAVGGALSGFFGTGGAMFTIPLMSMLFGFSQVVAQGFGYALMVTGMFAAIATFAHAGDVVWEYGIPLAIGGVVALPFGVRLAYRLPQRELRLVFVVVMFGSALALLAHARG